MGERLAKLWREIVWSWSPESERESSEAIVRNLWLHWFPAKITRAAMSWNYSLWLGTAAASLFFILTVTGVMLMFFYVPSTERAYGSIKDLQYAVSFGRVLRNQHRWAAEGMVAVVFLHMARVFFTGAYRGTRAANWLVGVALLLGTLLLSFTGYLLPWDQLAIWAITVGSNMASATPLLGLQGPATSLLKIGDIQLVTSTSDARFGLLGGRFVGAGALLRFYVLHCVGIPLIAAFLMAVHFWRVRKDGGISGPM